MININLPNVETISTGHFLKIHNPYEAYLDRAGTVAYE